MSPLHMIRLDPEMARVMEWGAREGLTRPGGDDGYLWHGLLKAAFDDLAPKPFRFVEPRNGRPAYLVGYGSAGEDELRRRASEFADPAVTAALRLSSVAVKTMPDTFDAGRRLGFELRVRPVVRQTRDGDRKRKREIDVFLQRASAGAGESKPVRADVYRDWLAARLASGGAALDDMRILWLRRAQITRRDATRVLDVHGCKGGGPDACFEGILTVTDRSLFRASLARGVGRHRAFGFGMLLLKPPAR